MGRGQGLRPGGPTLAAMLRGRVQSPPPPAGMVGGEGDWKRRHAGGGGVPQALGRAGKEVLPSGGNNVTDGRGWVGMRAARVEGLRKEPDRLETGCSFRGPPGSLVVRTWSQPGNEILQKRKKNWQDSEAKGRIDDSKIGTTGGLGRGDGLTREMCILKNLC